MLGHATFADVGQAGYLQESPVKKFDLTNTDMHDVMFSKRTVRTAKKRLMIINSCSPEQALILYLGSAESEKESIAGFLTRHQLREIFIRDHTFREVNIWVTELHLSFYKTISFGCGRSAAPRNTILEDPEEFLPYPGDLKSLSKRLGKGAIGWRFSGDLHDRRWTGTVLTFVPGTARDSNWISTQELEINGRCNGQRKVIEARLFSDMVKTVYDCTKEFLEILDKSLGEEKRAIYQSSSEHHDPFSESFDQSYSRSKLYLQVSGFLGHLDDNFNVMESTIKDYFSRENQRSVQPRWSVEDERQYRKELRHGINRALGTPVYSYHFTAK